MVIRKSANNGQGTGRSRNQNNNERTKAPQKKNDMMKEIQSYFHHIALCIFYGCIAAADFAKRTRLTNSVL